jgi:hypothetical protein
MSVFEFALGGLPTEVVRSCIATSSTLPSLSFISFVIILCGVGYQVPVFGRMNRHATDDVLYDVQPLHLLPVMYSPY